MSHTRAWRPRAAPGQVECGQGRVWAGQSQCCQQKPQGAAGASPWQWRRGPAIPQLMHPKPGDKGQSEGSSWGESRFGITLAQAAVLQLLLIAVFQGFPEPFPKGPASPDRFSTSEWCWIDGMQGADPPGAGASAALPAAPMQWQGAQPAGARRKGRRRALQQEPFLPRCSGREGVLHSRGQAASSWLSVSFHSLLTDKLLRMFLLCPMGPVLLYPHPALSTSCSIHG